MILSDSMSKDKGWDFLNSDDVNGTFNSDEDDGSWGYKNSYGSGSFYDSDNNGIYYDDDDYSYDFVSRIVRLALGLVAAAVGAGLGVAVVTMGPTFLRVRIMRK